MFIRPSYSSLFDIDALNFIREANITEDAEPDATNELVINLKQENLWSDMRAIYPFVGRTATSNGLNLKNPAEQISWSGGLTHNKFGVTGNGSTGTGDTGIAVNSTTPNSLSFGTYTITDVSALEMEIGSTDTSEYVGILTNFTDNKTYYYNQVAAFISNSTPNSKGFFVSSRTSSSSHKGYRNGIETSSGSVAQGTLLSSNFFILSAGLERFSSKTLSFAFIGNGLSDAKILTLYQIVQQFQKMLGREV